MSACDQRRFQEKQYLDINVMLAPMDNPGINGVTCASFVRRAYREHNNVPHHPSISDEIEGIVPLLGSLRLLFNCQSMLVAHHWSFFAGVSAAATGKTLAKMPSPYVMDFLISCAAHTWIKIRAD
ncbi:hypothetical protein AMAG_15212 [Allomyces macrogynus ATCC 38327]|uniref:Uncharacterized protein n=1 Tax=Allomyces macrogynus (strain ATCC 38327) TaxID=578462 RepID=A0A0L0T816_ALLM3|nr:hypothetical protein AMAG_15212 [Allomyces macrogynus ATCC 38327]|eukprot:KNE70948.1 hypothetical protein AMAG_15212 [Allomyces macrogynus ATCC 38327]